MVSVLRTGGLGLVVAMAAVVCSDAFGFDYERYKFTDLDAMLAEPPPKVGADIHPGRPVKLLARLYAYAAPCPTGFLKRVMIATGIPKEGVGAVSVTQCIKVSTFKDKHAKLFIQDQVAEFLPKEIPLGTPVTLFAVHLFTDAEGPGLLVNEFSVGLETDRGWAKRYASDLSMEWSRYRSVNLWTSEKTLDVTLNMTGCAAGPLENTE